LRLSLSLLLRLHCSGRLGGSCGDSRWESERGSRGGNRGGDGGRGDGAGGEVNVGHGLVGVVSPCGLELEEVLDKIDG
jgi:hypothetical protein